MNDRILASLVLTALTLCAACGSGGGGAGGNGGSPGEDAFLVASRVRSLDTRTLFLSVLPSLDHGELILDGALEVPGISRARAYQGKVYVFDGESGVITRYVVDDGVLVEDSLDDGGRARFSMANEGITRYTNAIGFISPTRAYYIDIVLGTDQVVVWDPTAMTVTSTFPLEVERENLTRSGGNVAIIDDFVVMPISWFNVIGGTFFPSASMLVLSASEDRMIGIVDEEERCVLSSNIFVDSGAVYLVADKGGGAADLAVDPPGSLPPACLLRWTPGAESFDDDFYLDLVETTGYPLVSGALGRGDGTFLTMVYTSDRNHLEIEDLQEFVDGPLWQWAVIDFEAETSVFVDAIPPGGVASAGWVIDGEYHTTFWDGVSRSNLYQVETPSATELLTTEAEISTVDRIR